VSDIRRTRPHQYCQMNWRSRQHSRAGSQQTDVEQAKYPSWVITDRRNSMAMQSRNEVRSDLVKRTERLKGDEKEIIVAGDLNILLIFTHTHTHTIGVYSNVI